MSRLKEACYQAAVYLFGLHLVLTFLLLVAPSLGNGLVRTSLSLVAVDESAHHYYAWIFSLPVALLLSTPCFYLCRSHHYWLYNSRVHSAAFAPVHRSRDLFGLEWVRNAQAAVKEHRFINMLDGYFDRAGSTHWVKLPGSWMLHTRDHRLVKAMYATHSDDWDIGGSRQQVTAYALGRHSIFAVNGAEWKHARAMIRPAFVRNQIADLECTDRHVEHFLKRLPRDEGTSVDIQELLYMFTMDISTDFMFGHSTNMLTKPTPESMEFSRCFDLMMLRTAVQSRSGWLSSFRRDPILKNVINTCNGFVDDHVAGALGRDEKTQERDYVFMDEIIKSGASKDEIRSQLVSMILGGRDTGASVMASMLWVLARRPGIVVKIRRELESLNGAKPKWEELRNFKYLNNVLKETMRLYAPVATNGRVSNKDTVLPNGGGPDGNLPVFVPKGTTCRFSSHHIHRNKAFYGQDADEFRPERWDTLRPTWEYIPFAGGPRICIGQQFALTQMLYLTARLFQTFSGIEAADDRPMTQQIGTTIHLVNGCWIRLKPASE